MVVVLCCSCATAGEPHMSAIERQFVGKWEGARHTDWFLPDHTWFMDFQPGDQPRGTWLIRDRRLTKTYSNGGSASYRIVSIDSQKLVIADQHNFQYVLKRVP